MWPIFDWLLGGGPKAVGEGVKAVADGATGVIGTIWGDEAEEQRQLSAEQIALMQQFAGEFVARTQRTPWDSFVDGLNRLPRPLMTFGMIGLLGWACVDPPGFAIVMGALASVPEPLWAVWGAMVAFWFGARELHKVRDWKIDKAILRTAAEAVQVRPATAAPVAVAADSGRNTANAERALAATIWGEARGESEEGKLAVASVIANRAARPGWWGRDIRSVCLAPAQFSCWWDAQGPRVRNVDETDPGFRACLKIARRVLSGNYRDPTGGADHYHRDDVRPSWARGRRAIRVIGRHWFYKLGKTGQG